VHSGDCPTSTSVAPAEESLHFGVLVARSQVEMQSILGDAVLGYQQKEEVGGDALFL